MSMDFIIFGCPGAVVEDLDGASAIPLTHLSLAKAFSRHRQAAELSKYMSSATSKRLFCINLCKFQLHQLNGTSI